MNYHKENEKIINALKSVLRKNECTKFIALHEPYVEGTDAWKNVKDCLDTGWVSSAGKFVKQFEQELCKITGASYAVAVTNGTVALRLGLQLVGVKAGEEVLIPPLTFVATANAVAHIGATPHFIDIESETLGMAPNKLEKRLQEIAKWDNGILINRETK